MSPLMTILEGPQVERKPVKIRGVGGLNRNDFWLDVRNPSAPHKVGQVKVALNDFREFFSVRFELDD